MDEKSATYTSLMDEVGRDHLHWWIVFEKGNCDHWWTKLFDQEMRHCWAVKFDGEHFIAFRPYIGYTDVEILSIKDSRHIAPDATAACLLSALICAALGPGGDDPMLLSCGSDGWGVD